MSPDGAISWRWQVIQVAFVLSGACALAYEIVWGRWLVAVLGGTSIATCVVLTSYMGGLAAGAWAFGKWSARAKSPLVIYVGVELLIGLIAACFPAMAAMALELDRIPRIFVATSVLTGLTFLMGGTIPLVMSWSKHVGLPKGTTLGRIYGLNALGAAMGCVLAGFLLIPRLGLSVTNNIGVATNILIAIVVWAVCVAGGKYGIAGREQPEISTQGTGITSPWSLHMVALLSGIVTLGLEIIWIRLLRITLGSTTFTFTLVIATFICGIGLGGLISERLRERAGVKSVLARSQVFLVVILLLQFTVLPSTPGLFKLVNSLSPGGNELKGIILSSAVLCAFLLLPVTLVFGFMFPLLGRLYMVRGHPGSETGRFYMINTAGAVLGAVLTTVLFIPLLGTTGSYAVMIGLALVSLVVYIRVAGSEFTEGYRYAAVPIILALALIFFVRPSWSPDYLGVNALTRVGDSTNTAFFEEGRNSTVLVQDFAGERGMRIDGKPVASTVYDDRAAQLALGHFPAVLTNRVTNGLVIGLGTGMTSNALAQHGLERLDIVELEPAVAKAARFFDQYNGAVLARDEVRVVIDDGFNYLHTTDVTYDVITSDPIQPFFRGAATLYSKDYFERASMRLSEEGVVAHWLPLAQMRVDDFKLIVRTFAEAFPYARLYWTGAAPNTVLLGRSSPWMTPDVSRNQYVQASESLETIFIETPEELTSLLIANRETLLDWAGDGDVNTVDNPILEFTAPRGLHELSPVRNLVELLNMRTHHEGESNAWKAVSHALAHDAKIEPLRDRSLAFDYLRLAAGWGNEEISRPPDQVSGLLRRRLWEHSLLDGDLAMRRVRKELEFQSAPWFPRGGGHEFLRESKEAALKAYTMARELTSPKNPYERDAVKTRLEKINAMAIGN